MAKRFIDNGFFKDPFVRGLQGAYKGFYIYLFCDCSNGGIWNVELDVARLRCGIPETETDEKIKKIFSEKIIEVDNGNKWFLKNFLKVQHNGVLKRNNRAHTSAIEELLKFGLIHEFSEGEFSLKNEFKGLTRGLQDPMVKVKEEGSGLSNSPGNGKKKSNSFETEIYPTFDDFWNEYDKKTGKEKCISLWTKLKQEDREKIMQHIPDYKISQPDKKYRKNPETYLNNKSWNDEIILSHNGKQQTSNNCGGASTGFRAKTYQRLTGLQSE